MSGTNGGETLRKFIKFGMTGVLNTVIDFAVYTILVSCSVSLYLAQALGYGCGTLNSYCINRSWTFRSQNKFFSGELFRFLAVNLITLGLSMAALYLLQQWFSTPIWITLGSHSHEISKLVIKLPVTALTIVVNFILSKLWVFRS